jgi:aminoglycoside phosphotransferase (APT) family kinase protein
MTEETPPADIVAALHAMGLCDQGAPPGRRLTGGVSSDIWLVELPHGPVCVKRALAKLNVAADWRVPVGRNLYEARWMRRANAAAPGAAPALLGQDTASGALAMEYLPSGSHRLWKEALHAGCTSVAFSEQVGCTLARIHGATAADPSVAPEFPTDAIFFDIRLDPYLLATAARHPDRAEALRALVEATQANKRALVHGDVSPKNILIGPSGPVFLDAECAWWGDPAFDLAFCLNHLLLKCLWTPSARDGFLACFSSLTAGYLANVTWEPAASLEARAARLLPGLFLARVDGKSPVEYVTDEAQRGHVRSVARALLAAPPRLLDDVARAWRKELAA